MNPSKNLFHGAEMKIKICGITNLEDALFCSQFDVEMLGFIFYRGSKRFIEPSEAKKIISQLPNSIISVGVFVDEPYDSVNDIASNIGLGAVQLHGNESPEYVSKIKIPVIKSFRVHDNFDWSLVENYNGCDILLDSYSSHEKGGTGKSFAWELIPNQLRSKIILSGGISIENLEKIFSDINPVAIDLSSALESSPGKKDHKKIGNFIKKFNELRK